MKVFRAVTAIWFAMLAFGVHAQNYPAPNPGDFKVKDFQFKSGEKLAEVKLHYYTLGTAQKTQAAR